MQMQKYKYKYNNKHIQLDTEKTESSLVKRFNKIGSIQYSAIVEMQFQIIDKQNSTEKTWSNKQIKLKQ